MDLVQLGSITAKRGFQNERDVVSKFNNLVKKNKGVVIKVDEWGKKTLAYEVKKFGKGYYVLLQYCGGPGITAELKRDLSIDERVLKYQTIKLSDDADPEALEAKAEEGTIEPPEEAGTTEEVSSDQNGRINQEG